MQSSDTSTVDKKSIVRGAYLVALRDWIYAERRVCAAGDLALVFRAPRAETAAGSADVLLESGRSVTAVPLGQLRDHFDVVYVEPGYVICGCSSHEGWDKARALLAHQA